MPRSNARLELPWEMRAVGRPLVVSRKSGRPILTIEAQEPPTWNLTHEEHRVREAAIWAHVVLAANAHDDLMHALAAALPFVEDAAGDPVYKPGAVAKVIAMVKHALAKGGEL